MTGNAMTILVTGGLGFLGANLCYEFLEDHQRVVAYDLTYRIPKFLKSHVDNRDFIFVKGDITDIWNLIETAKKYDVIDLIHTATLMEDKASVQRPYQFLRTNILGGINVLEIARILKLRKVVIVSSRAAYGSYAPAEGPLREDSHLRPTAFYGASKASVDLMVPLYRNHYRVDAVSIRTTGVFGPGQGEEGMGHVGTTAPIYNILTCILKGNPFFLPSGGDHCLEFCYVRDLVAGIRRILETPAVQHPVYNLSAGKLFKVSEIVDVIEELIPGSEIKVGPGPFDGVELRAALDISLAQREFGYRPSPIKESIKDFIHYLTS